jgi:hypothetical protein
MLATGVDYDELGAYYLDQLKAGRLTRYYLRRLEELGLQVEVQQLPHAA